MVFVAIAEHGEEEAALRGILFDARTHVSSFEEPRAAREVEPCFDAPPAAVTFQAVLFKQRQHLFFVELRSRIFPVLGRADRGQDSERESDEELLRRVHFGCG